MGDIEMMSARTHEFQDLSEGEQTGIINVIRDYWFHPQDEMHYIKDEMRHRVVVKIKGYISDGPGFTGDLYLILAGYPEASLFVGYSQSSLKELESERWALIYTEFNQ